MQEFMCLKPKHTEHKLCWGQRLPKKALGRGLGRSTKSLCASEYTSSGQSGLGGPRVHQQPTCIEATRDLITSATLAFQHSQQREEQAHEKASWRAVATSFWQDTVVDNGGQPRKRQRVSLHRTKSYEWLCATTHMLQIAASKTWQDFVPAPDTNMLQWPFVSICVDQGSDGWTATSWLLAKGANLQRLFDWSHCNWNDVSLALGDTQGLNIITIVTIIIMNLDHGPWQNCTWYEEIRAGAEEFLNIASPQDPLYEQLWPNMAFEKGLDVLNNEAKEQTFANLRSCTWKKTEGWSHQVVPLHHRSSLLPWGSGQSGFASVSMWPCSWACSNMGKHPSASSFRIAMKTRMWRRARQGLTRSRFARREQQQRTPSRIQFVCMMLQDRKLWRKNYLICDVSMVVRRWRSFQNKANRSATESLQWHRDRACDLGLEHINAILSKVSSTSLLEKLSIEYGQPSTTGSRQLDAEPPLGE